MLILKLIKRYFIKRRFETIENIILSNKSILNANPYNNIKSMANHVLKFDKYSKARSIISEIYKQTDIYFIDKNDIKVIDRVKRSKFYSWFEDIHILDEDTLIYCGNNIVFIPHKEKKRYILYYLSPALNHEIRLVITNLDFEDVKNVIKAFLIYIRRSNITSKHIEFKRNIMNLFTSVSYVYVNDKNYYDIMKEFIEEVL
jgi:hypothetical protein